MEKMNLYNTSVQTTVYSGIKPESPVATPVSSMDEKIQFFAPVAGYEREGLASFLEEHFSIVNGKVKIKKSLIDLLITSHDTLTALLAKVSDGTLASEMNVIVSESSDEKYTDTVSNLFALLRKAVVDVTDLYTKLGTQVSTQDTELRTLIQQNINTLNNTISQLSNLVNSNKVEIDNKIANSISKTEATGQTLAGTLIVPQLDVRKNGITNATIYGDGTVSAEKLNAQDTAFVMNKLEVAGITDTGTLVAGNAEISGNLIVKGATQTAKLENLTIKDNVVIVNSGGISFANSGLVIATSATAEGGYVAYGILYGDTDEVVSIGKGVLKYDENGNASFVFDEGEAIPLAARSGAFNEGDIPLWDAEKNAFKSSGIGLDEVGGGITEWDYEITDPLKFTKLNLSKMSGNVLVKNCGTVGFGSEIDIPSSITTLKFINTKVDGILKGEGNTTIIGYTPATNSTYTCAIRNFGKVENASGSAQIINCKHISNSELWIANGCSFISDCTTIVGTHDSYTAVFENCKHIHGISVLDRNSKVEFKGCSFISNVSSDLSADGVITYTNCKYVDALTCVGYGAGVPYVDANGIVSFLTNAEGGYYGS